MTLTTKAYLEIEGLGTTATFELQIGLQEASELTKSYLMGERGQYIREIVNQTPGTGSFDAERRTGFWVDGGAGDWQPILNFETGLEDVTWGDGNSGTGPENVTPTDASGKGVKPISRMQVFQYWVAKTRSDSQGDARLHVGEWTDGSFGEDGAYDAPMPVAIKSTNLNIKEPNQGTASLEGSITMSHVALFGGYGAPDWVDNIIGAVNDAANILSDI